MTEGTLRSLNRQDTELTAEELRRVRARQPEALNAFFECYFDRAFGYVFRLVRDRDEAQDITQVAFMKIHRAVHTLDPDRDPTPWVFTVVSNAVRDFWRSKRHRQSRLDQSIEKTVIADGQTAEDELDAREAARVLEQALGELSEKLRSVILLRDYEGLSYAEIAEALGIGEGTARKRHSRALGELREAMERADQPVGHRNLET